MIKGSNPLLYFYEWLDHRFDEQLLMSCSFMTSIRRSWPNMTVTVIMRETGQLSSLQKHFICWMRRTSNLRKGSRSQALKVALLFGWNIGYSTYHWNLVQSSRHCISYFSFCNNISWELQFSFILIFAILVYHNCINNSANLHVKKLVYAMFYAN